MGFGERRVCCCRWQTWRWSLPPWRSACRYRMAVHRPGYHPPAAAFLVTPALRRRTHSMRHGQLAQHDARCPRLHAGRIRAHGALDSRAEALLGDSDVESIWSLPNKTVSGPTKRIIAEFRCRSSPCAIELHVNVHCTAASVAGRDLTRRVNLQDRRDDYPLTTTRVAQLHPSQILRDHPPSLR